MASTRNKNTSSDYRLEQYNNDVRANYIMSYGGENDIQMAGNGLIQGRIFANKLSHNSVDIESFLRGINSTNLVNPAPLFEPQLRSPLPTRNMFQNQPIVMPEPLIIEKNQRPFY